MGSFYDLLLASKLSGGGGGGGGGSALEDALLTNTTDTTYTNNRITTLRRGAFNYLTSAETMHLGALETIAGADAFAWSGVKTLVLPSLKKGNADSYLMRDARELLTIDFGPAFDYISNYYFSACVKLNKIILRCPTVVTLQTTNAMEATCFKNNGAGGEIYVPSALISSYQTASNWSTYNGYGTITWKAIETSTYATQYADGTPISA